MTHLKRIRAHVTCSCLACYYSYYDFKLRIFTIFKLILCFFFINFITKIPSLRFFHTILYFIPWKFLSSLKIKFTRPFLPWTFPSLLETFYLSFYQPRTALCFFSCVRILCAFWNVYFHFKSFDFAQKWDPFLKTILLKLS